MTNPAKQADSKRREKNALAAERRLRKKAQAAPIEFRNVKLSAEDVEAIKNGMDTPLDAWGRLLELLDNGYKVGLSADKEHDSYIVSLTAKDTADISEISLCLTARGSTPDNAVLSLMYKFEVICQGSLCNAEVQPRRELSDFG